DSTDPSTIRRTEKSVDLARTLFIVASKAGTTLEVKSFLQYFYHRLRDLKGNAAGSHFIAITDPGTPLEALAEEQHFQKIFLNPPDIGGRYSALSYFGLIPAALLGIDVRGLLDQAKKVADRCRVHAPVEENPGVYLGAVLGELGRIGLDKITLLCAHGTERMGDWIEQLLAESTGKQGMGLIPIAGEVVGEPMIYGRDRAFIHYTAGWTVDKKLQNRASALKKAGYPVVQLELKNPLEIGAEFFRWEIATAVAGAILEINPFDEPNVTESKENTRRVLEEFQRTGRLRSRKPLLEEGGMLLYAGTEAKQLKGSCVEVFRRFLGQLRESDYVALMAYIDRSPRYEAVLQRLRHLIRGHYRVATMLGFGPQFLHSTGQLYKGGPKNGLFLQITAEDSEDISIPGEAYTFGVVKQAQALGDFQSMTRSRLRVLEVHLGRDVKRGLQRLVHLVEGAVRSV
ncbi:MAG: bifunctional transaldolase/phosoglucose isomerase, partial [Nitrospiria bacterium]